ncbi:MAG: AAA family ATPase [Syntrophobacterales bacterium]|nr:MAG: AAA family ATPase [Syntrophobacterales bacterium]
MYTSYFGLQENPFNVTPDTRYLFLSQQHSEALNHLLYGINEKKGFMVITGGIGTGKTTICRKLLSLLDESIDTALIFNSSISDIELLETVNQEFGIPSGTQEKTRKGYIDNLNRFLLRNFTAGRNAVLLIDEAQNISSGVLEQIRMLSNLETEKEKLLQIILIGQPELQELLASPSLRQLNERITVRYTLTPLDSYQTRGYIQHRLAVASTDGNGTIHFTRWAYRKIYRYSRGIPRRINAICDRALLIAYSRDSNTISRKIIKEGAYDIGGGQLAYERGLDDRRGYWLVTFVLIMLTFLLVVVANRVPLVEFFSQTDFLGWPR